MTLAKVLLRALKQFGAKQVWGIPGDFILPFFHEMESSGILPLFTLSHEPSVAFAADASARIDHGLGVVAVTYGAGALNTVNAVAQAYAERSPLVVIAGVPGERELELGLQLHHQVKSVDSQAHIFEEITCAQVRLKDVDSAPGEIAKILTTCKERSLPILIEIPRNIAKERCFKTVPQPEEKTESSKGLKDCLGDIQSKIMAAKRPVVITGVEVKRYGAEALLCQWLGELDIPCFTTLMGKGIAAEEENSPVLGTYLGEAGDSRFAALVEQSDLVVYLGVIKSDSNFAVCHETLSNRASVFIQHREVTVDDAQYQGYALNTVIKGLIERARSKAWAPEREVVTEAFKWPRKNNTAIKPMMIAQALNECFERFGPLPVSSDVGDCLFVTQALESVVVAPGYYASMGFGVPAGMAIQASTGRRPVILVGDGAFQMTGMELGHCRRYGFTPIVVVLNNHGWEMIRAFSPESKSADLGRWPFASMANMFIGEGIKATTPEQLRNALEWAFQDPTQAYLIDVHIAPGCRTPSLSHFAQILTSQH